ncbi:MAG: ABC transporter ATP-binding protein/permease [Treponema sp.]|jgi:ATP-binding cassette subfamily B protein|nr:ABC transporter ATP-binding protein/permease [Treponema sp.]
MFIENKKYNLKLPWKGGRIALIAASAKDRKLKMFLCCVSTMAMAGFALLNPQVVRFTIDSVIGTEAPNVPGFVLRFINFIGGQDVLRQNFWICAVVIAALALFSELCNMARNYTAVEVGETISWRLRNTLYSHIQKLSWDWHVSCQTGDIIQRCTTDVDHMRNFVQYNLSELLRTICIFVIAVIMMFSMDIFMSMISLALIPLILIFSIVYFSRVSKNFARADVAEGIMQAAAQENYTGVRVVRAFGREAYERDKFYQKTRDYANIWIQIAKMIGTFWSVSDLFCGLQLAVIIAAGVWRCVNGDLTPGAFIAFYAYCNWMIWPVRELGRILSELSKTLVASTRVKEILEAEPEIDSQDALYPEIKGEICFDKVGFAYKETEPVLHDISFTLKPGETMAILGATGSGKSSLVHLLSRLYDLPDGSGTITIDGIDIRKIARSHLRKHIGLCLQEPFLFSKTIRENIAAAQEGMEIAELQSAASVAMVHDTIEGFSDGYETVIGERGVTLSGGQKQRVSIARMLAGNTPIMIFDDSLSAVDTETDAKIRAALRKRVKDAAVIIISHRISTLMQADKILILKNGTVEDIGSHNELLERGGTYKRIFEMQAAGLIDGVEE